MLKYHRSFLAIFGLITACHPLSHDEAKLIGEWENNYPDASANLTFRPNHVVEWEYKSGANGHSTGWWHLQGSRLTLDRPDGTSRPSAVTDTILELSAK